ncbi:imidazolonepropionase [Robiginitalea sp. M366]|uniref:imidazolonepropionase n=1 Tax=Robiginitalea aestuariiviva TaxID=3036903 RepID=UPI00240DA161|nr:imidazolonepropionase [Robiginitalea aestuariiviva]MDG1571106.1 imidazolonepropionase [Robiginitalea aestuariiviva]
MAKKPTQRLIGPFTQLLTLNGLPLKGPLRDSRLEVIHQGGLLVERGRVLEAGPYSALAENAADAERVDINGPAVAVPGWVDAHTHSCFAGSRARDYALRNSGSSYQEIAAAGGGIWDTVGKTRKASQAQLTELLLARCQRFVADGITTLEVKSGYGLSITEELKMLRAIREAGKYTLLDLVPTCLAAHMAPRDFGGSPEAYLEQVARELLPQIRKEELSLRVDAFVEKGAFTPEQTSAYFSEALRQGFELTVHADQFSTGGSAVAIGCGARSADHLEASGPAEIEALAQSQVVAMALPGASLGLGCGYTPARALLDAGGCLAIASDYNPGSAPMGDLIAQASILGAAEKLSNAEVLAGITFRAAAALGLSDRGRLLAGARADFNVYPTDHYNEITYHQGRLKPASVWKNGQCILDTNAETHA